MTVIPAVNETEFAEVEKKIIMAADFGASWVHLDVSDGRFAKNKLWNNPADLLNAKDRLPGVNLEVHLMVDNPDDIFDDWIDAGAKRIIVHTESVKDLATMKIKCDLFGVELFLAANPDTSVAGLLAEKKIVSGFLILAVNPGKAGQIFRENQLEKIKILRQSAPDVKIEVDGGVNSDNAPAIKNAGADMLISASAIWGSGDPKEMYKKLNEL